jgi:PAS domain S-box-containing protein
MSRFPRPAWLRYLVALIAVVAVMEARIHLQRVDKIDGPPLTMMLMAVIVAATFGGMGPGVLATLAGAALCGFKFISPQEMSADRIHGYELRLGLFVIEGLFISCVFYAMKRSSAATRQMERNLRLIAENTTDVIFAYDMSGQLMYVNSAFEALTGNSIGELRENPLMNYVHPDDSQRMQELFGGLFLGKRFKDVEYRIIANDGQVKWCRATWGPLVDEYANQIGIQGREADITEQRRSESTLKFLADACAVLAAHKGPEETLGQIARVAVPQYADWCAVDLINGDGRAKTVAAAHADASKEPWLSEIQRSYPPAPEAREGPGAVLRTGQPEILPVVTDAWLAAGAADGQHLKLLHNLAPRSVLCVPLKCGQQTLGAITFVSSEAQRRYDADDLVFATDLGRRIAESVEREAVGVGK